MARKPAVGSCHDATPQRLGWMAMMCTDRPSPRLLRAADAIPLRDVCRRSASACCGYDRAPSQTAKVISVLRGSIRPVTIHISGRYSYIGSVFGTDGSTPRR